MATALQRRRRPEAEQVQVWRRVQGWRMQVSRARGARMRARRAPPAPTAVPHVLVARATPVARVTEARATAARRRRPALRAHPPQLQMRSLPRVRIRLQWLRRPRVPVHLTHPGQIPVWRRRLPVVQRRGAGRVPPPARRSRPGPERRAGARPVASPEGSAAPATLPGLWCPAAAQRSGAAAAAGLAQARSAATWEPAPLGWGSAAPPHSAVPAHRSMGEAHGVAPAGRPAAVAPALRRGGVEAAGRYRDGSAARR